MATNHALFRHIAGQQDVTIAKVIDGTNSAATLCQSGISYPIAVSISKMITAGVGDVGALHRAGFSASDAAAIAAAINAGGAH